MAIFTENLLLLLEVITQADLVGLHNMLSWEGFEMVKNATIDVELCN